MSATDQPGEPGESHTVEIVTGGIDDDGYVVIDDLVAEVDSEGHIIATDEMILIELPDGEIIVDETFSIVGSDGELHAVEEELTLLETKEPEETAS